MIQKMNPDFEQTHLSRTGFYKTGNDGIRLMKRMVFDRFFENRN